MVGLLLIFLLGIVVSKLFNIIKIPKIIGLILLGILLSYCSFINDTTILVGDYLRKLALIIILTRAGMSLDLNKLKQIGTPAILLCFIPAIFEVTSTVIFAPMLLGIDYLEALLLGCVLAAVSPAIIVPRMIKYKEKYASSVPDMLLASSSVDDIFVITLFYSVLSVFNENSVVNTIIQLPTSIILGVVFGVLIGFVIKKIFKKYNVNTIVVVVITLVISILLTSIEVLIKDYVQYQSLISIMIIGLSLIKLENIISIKNSYNKLWYVFEIFLFVLVGISVDITVAFDYGFNAIILIFIILLFRSLGVCICLLKTNTSKKEKIFCVIGYLPKATVQASIGAIPLSFNIEGGAIILSMAVLSILITAPIGATLLDTQTDKLLK